MMSRHWQTALQVSVVMLLSALLAALGIAGWQFAAAQSPGAAQQAAGVPVVWAAGTIKEVRGNGFTLTTPKNEVAVTTSSQTWIVLNRLAEGSNASAPSEGQLADLKAGAWVQVGGTGDPAKAISARVVYSGRGPDKGGLPGDGREHGPMPPAKLTGTISAINGATLTLTLDDSSTLQVGTEAGTIVLRGGGFAAVGDLKVGDKVQLNPMMGPLYRGPDNGKHIWGMMPGGPNMDPAAGAAPAEAGVAVQGERVFVAQLIWVPAEGEQLISGVVAAVDGTTIKLGNEGANAGWTVQAAGAAVRRISGPGMAAATAAVSDVAAGNLVVVLGSPVSGQTSTLAARAIILHPMPAPNGPGKPWGRP